MAHITDDDVKKMAHLARLAIDEKDIPYYSNSLRNTLNLIEQMQEVDTNHIQPMAHSADMHQRLRDDIVTEPNERDNLQKLAPATEFGLYLVPQVIE